MGMTEHTAIRARRSKVRSMVVAMMASDVEREAGADVAAGVAGVGGAWSRWGTSGRGRPITAAAVVLERPVQVALGAVPPLSGDQQHVGSPFSVGSRMPGSLRRR